MIHACFRSFDSFLNVVGPNVEVWLDRRLRVRADPEQGYMNINDALVHLTVFRMTGRQMCSIA